MQGMILSFASNLQVTYGAPTYRLSLLKRTFSLIKLHVIGLVKTKFKLFSAFKSVVAVLRVYLFGFLVQQQLDGSTQAYCLPRSFLLCFLVPKKKIKKIRQSEDWKIDFTLSGC